MLAAPLLSLGGTCKTNDVEVAVTAPALHTFYAAAAHDPRFKKGPTESWEYTASSGIIVPFKFLMQGRGFAPVIRAARETTADDGMRAGLSELTTMKARAWQARDEEKDLEDLKFLLVKMEEMGESFPVLAPEAGEEMGDLKALTAAGKDAEGPHEACVRRMLWL